MEKYLFKMPHSVSVSGRTSTITKACVDGIIPKVTPTEEQVLEVLEMLGMSPDKVECAYCGGRCTTWDHFNSLVDNSIATGYFSEIYNLIPSCESCNSSRGNRYWRDWMLSDAPRSPKTRKVPDLENRIKHIEVFEEWSRKHITKLDMESIVGNELWEHYWKERDRLIQSLKEFNDMQKTIKRILQNKVDGKEDASVDCGTLKKQSNNGNKEKVVISDTKLEIAYYFLMHKSSLIEVEKVVLGIKDGNGSRAKYHLDSLGITTEKKGVLANSNIQNEIQNADGKYKIALLEIQKRYSL